MLRLQQAPDAPRYVLDDMVEDMIERLEFLRQTPERALVVGDVHAALAQWLETRGCEVVRADPVPAPGVSPIDEERPIGSDAPFDLVASLATLDTVNDLPGALVHLRRALAAGGLMLASFSGAGGLPSLRAAMLAADGSRPAPRIHPQIEVRAAAALLQRCGFADPVVDSRSLAVRFGSIERLVADLRGQALGNVLARPGPPLSRTALARAAAAFTHDETFEIVTLTGWNRAG
jgi:SAM-dependent methyltransferase